MQGVSSTVLFRINKTLKSRLSLHNLIGILSNLQYCNIHDKRLDITMAKLLFKGRSDHYNGITIDSLEETCDNQIFAQRLKGSRIFLMLSILHL